MIIKNEIPPGETLQIDKLANQFGVSTTPVREALLKLQNSGFVEITPNKSATVTHIDVSQVEDIYEFRTLLEAIASKAVAEQAKDQELDNLEECFNQVMEKPDVAMHIKGEEELDKLFFKYTTNKLIRDTLRDLKQRGQRISFYNTSSSCDTSEILTMTQEHLNIVKAFKEHSPIHAEACVKEHLENARKRTLKALESCKIFSKKE